MNGKTFIFLIKNSGLVIKFLWLLYRHWNHKRDSSFDKQAMILYLFCDCGFTDRLKIHE